MKTQNLLGSILILASACGGRATVLLGDDPNASAPAGGGGAGGAGDAAVPPFDIIDDMEDADEFLPARNGRSGSWAIYHDETPGATQWPPRGGLFVGSEISPPRGASHFAVRTYGGGFNAQPGGGWASATVWFISLAVQAADAGNGEPPGVYDATSYRGVTFWARVGPTSQTIVRLGFEDSQTNPKGGICQGDACFNSFGKSVGLNTEWTEHTILFSDLKQNPTWGGMFPALDTRHLFGFEFTFLGPEPFDFWVDDIAFVR